MDKNNSFLHLKGESNIFNSNGHNNHNDSNLSSLLSSNSILNFNNIIKINNRFQSNRDRKNIKSTSIDQSSSNINNNMSYYGITQRNNKNQNNLSINNNQNNMVDEKCKKKLNQLCYNFSSKDLNGSFNGPNPGITGRNKSHLKISFKIDNSNKSNSSLISPINKKDESNYKIKLNINRELNNSKHNNYIQLRQLNLENGKNILPFYLPNLDILNNKKIFNALNFDNFKKKGKINLNSLKFKLKNKNKKVEKYFLVPNKKQNQSNIKRSESTLLFASQINLEPKINNFMNKNHENKRIDEIESSTIMSSKNKRHINFNEEKIKRNSSDIF